MKCFVQIAVIKWSVGIRINSFVRSVVFLENKRGHKDNSVQSLLMPIEKVAEPKKKTEISLLRSHIHTIITSYVIAEDVGYSDFFSVLFVGLDRPRLR